MVASGKSLRGKSGSGYSAGGGMTKAEKASMAEWGGSIPDLETAPAYQRERAALNQEMASGARVPYAQSAQSRLTAVQQEHSKAVAASREVRESAKLRETQRARVLAKYNADTPERAAREILRRYIAATR